MKRWKKVVLSLALTACVATPLAVGVSFLGKQTGDASVKNDGSYVLVDELWNNDDRVFLRENVNTLLKYLGLDGKTLTEINNTPIKNASDFRTVEIEGEKNSGQDVNVMLGGLEWTVCYLSHDEYNDRTFLTLWLSNSTQDAFAGRSQTEGEHYGYITDSVGTGLYSDWSYNWEANNPSDSYPSNMYGTSYVRAVTLNNGGKYALSGSTLSAEVEKDSNSAFALFTMSANNDGNDLVNYIVTPNSMSWQESGQSAKVTAGFSYKTPNDNLGVEDNTGYYSSCNYSSKSGYDTWKNDKLWLPSMSETGRNTTYTGLWQTSVGQRKNYNGSTKSTGSTVGTNNGSAFAYSWLRSGFWGNATHAYVLYPSGDSDTVGVSHSYAVRPALHLGLSRVIDYATDGVNVSFDAKGGECSTDSIRYYKNSSASRKVSLPTPTKTGYKFNGWYGEFDGTESSAWLLGSDYNYIGELNVHLSAYSDDWSRLEGDDYERLISYALVGGMGWKIESDINDTKQYITFTAYDDEICDYRRAVSNIKFSDLSVGWHDFDMTLYDGFLSGYIDGKKVATVGFAGRIEYYHSGRGLVVGGEYDNIADWNIDHCFTGYIGNVAIENECFYPNLIMPKGSYYNIFLLPYDDVTLYAKWGDWVEYKSYYDYFIDNMDCTGVYDTDGNLTNVTISAEKKAEILATDFTGSGTSTDPYQVNSSLGFWYMSKFVTLSNKYVELNCDVILNDEHFDEDGNVLVDANGVPIYGDGIVYSWEPILNASLMIFNGNYHNINGLYFNNLEKGKFTLFGNYTVSEIKNLNIKNIFLKAEHVYTFCYVCKIMENCNAINGTIIAQAYASGFVDRLEKTMKNCNNYVNIFGHYVGGIVCTIYSNLHCYIENCCNYGNIIGYYDPNYDKNVYSSRIGGLFGANCGGMKAINCINYGNIKGNQIGGLIADASGEHKGGTFINCANYGELDGEKSDSEVGGFIAHIYSGKWHFINCVVECNFTGLGSKGIFVKSVPPNYQVDFECIGCSAKVGSVVPIVRYIGGWNKTVDAVIRNCRVEYNFDKINETTGLMFFEVKEGSSEFFENIEIVVNCDEFKGRLIKVIDKTAKLKNILLTVNAKTVEETDPFNGKDLSFVENVIININSPTTSIKKYYGTNFRDFYLDWRTDKIGLNALDGVGSFQGKITEEWLVNNGYVKKG